MRGVNIQNQKPFGRTENGIWAGFFRKKFPAKLLALRSPVCECVSVCVCVCVCV